MTRNKSILPARWTDKTLPLASQSAPRELRLDRQSPRPAAIAMILTLSVIVPLYGTAADLIAFQTDRDGDAEIMIMDPDGKNQRQLTDNEAHDYNPRWSPDGSKIIFSSDRDGNHEIYIMNIDGSDPKRLTDSPGQDTYPSMSPDGGAIVFESYRDGHAEIYRMNADGTGVTRLTHYDGKIAEEGDFPPGNGNPSWSPR